MHVSTAACCDGQLVNSVDGLRAKLALREPPSGLPRPMVSVVPTLPGSSSRRFNVSSRVARKGTGKNLATRRDLLSATPSLFSVYLPTAVLLGSAIRDVKLQKHRYGSPLNASPKWTTIIVAKMPAQNTELNRSQALPFLDLRRIVFTEKL